ncbi:hypothetical protein ACPPVO_26435 [Dactylosporangium sp. McL0621]|uniref:hypothetical protein n=1 Tax=Dactylosporangium sp. McL0621 TaxID=3415678 RepID=UPI003CF7084B
MGSVLTTASTVTCVHDGAVTFTGQTKLRFATNPVLVRIDPLLTNTAIGCKNSGTGITPCKNVTGITGGVAVKLRAGAGPVLLDGLAGTTNGVVAGVFQLLRTPATADQTKLTAQ